MTGLALAAWLLYLAPGGAFGPAQHNTNPAPPHRIAKADAALSWRVASSAAASTETGGSAEKGYTVSAASPAGAQVTMTADEARFLALANKERGRVGLKPLTGNPLLVSIARRHSEEMYRLDYFAHESPNPDARTPMQRYLAGVKSYPGYALVGENLYYCSRVDVNRGHRAFMNSPHHRENILDPRFESMGIGIFKGRDGSFYVTEMFLTNHQARQTRTAEQKPQDKPREGG